MGVPAFYRWLVTKYPKVVTNATLDPILDPSAPNPNGLEFDNLYLDMNGIIHPCFHPEDLSDFQPTTFKEVFNTIFEYVDRLFDIVRPRKLIFFAIDGVAPRAKMNQQRSRRFQSAKNSVIAEEKEDRLRIQYEGEGKKLLPKTKSQLHDSNIITPGTEFMYELSKALQFYIQTRLQENPAWKNLKVILSDSNVPGEGEHKIMSFIRSQRSLPDYDVNARHCLHGLDADLIMLALATHELHFSILREDVLTVKEEQPLSIPTREGPSIDRNESCKSFPVKKTCSYQFLHIWILRQYLELDMKAFDAPEGFKFDVDRAVDDFVFLCFFVGNDFLPRLPSLEINEGALDLMMTVYKKDFNSLGGYIVNAQRTNEPNGAYLKMKRVEKLVQSLGSYEDLIFQKRTELRERKMRNILNELAASRDEEAGDDVDVMDIPIIQVSPAYLNTNIHNTEYDDILKNTKQLKEDVKRQMRDEEDVFKTGQFPADKIKYGTAGWKERYYQEKFATEDHLKLESTKKEVVKEYYQGLCWVLLYYYSGVPSWTWFYPFHYGPCASDLKGFGQMKVKFHEGSPFEPFDQLMAVLPPKSAEALPIAFRNLMLDESSDLAPYYPQEFKIDMDAKRFLWQGKCILPFIDEKLLLSSTRKAKQELKDYEEERNVMKNDYLFTSASSDFGFRILHSNANGIGGFVNMNLHALDSSTEADSVLCVTFSLSKPEIHIPRILPNVELPERVVSESDICETVLWHEQKGGSRGQRFPTQGRCVNPPETESSGLVGSSGWRGRGRGRGRGKGVGTHPNESDTMVYQRSPILRPYAATMNPATSNSYRNPFPVVDHCGSFGPQRPMPAAPGFRPRVGHSNHHSRSNYTRPTSRYSENHSYSPQFVSTPQMVGQFRNSNVSSRPDWRSIGRGRGGRGMGQFSPTQARYSENRGYSPQFVSTPQMVGQFRNLSVSSRPEGRSTGRGRGGRGMGQFWPTQAESGYNGRW